MTSSLTPPTPLPERTATRAARRSRLRGWLVGLLVLSLFAGGAFAGYYLGEAKSVLPVWDPLWMHAALDRPLDTSGPGDGFWVSGYWVGYDIESLRTLQQRSPHLDQVVAFSYGFYPDGRVQGRDPFILRGVVAAPKRVLLFANMTDGDFSADLARTLLTDPEARARSLQEIVAKTLEYGAAGAQLDYEGVPRELRSELTSYVRDLAAALDEHGLSLSMAVPAKVADSPNSAWSGAFDYPALGAALDEMYIMAYDEHYRLGPPGPVGSLPWTEKVIRYAISVVPTKKIVLGVPGYGYDWLSTDQAAPPGGTGSEGAAGGGSGGAKSLSSRFAIRFLTQKSARVDWDPMMGENVAVYGDASSTHTVWFPDERSLEGKIGLATKYNLKGVALWRLGLEAPSFWAPLAAFRLMGEEATPVTAPGAPAANPPATAPSGAPASTPATP